MRIDTYCPFIKIFLVFVIQLTFTCLKLAIETRKEHEICAKLIKTPKRRHWRRSGVFIVNFEHILHIFLSSVSIVDFKQVNVTWAKTNNMS